MLQQLANIIDSANQKIGQIISWIALFMVLMMFFNVISRYALNINLVWQQELVRFLHAILFLAGAAYTLLCDKHVRVDVIYQNLSERNKALTNLIGTIIFLIPVTIAIAYFSSSFIIESWKIYEASPEYMGMPGVFILKSFIWLFCLLLSTQGLSNICKSLIILKG